MRRTFIREGIENKIPTHVMMSMSGHSTERVYHQYFSTTSSELDEEGRKLFSLELYQKENKKSHDQGSLENQLLEFKNGNVQVLMCNSLLFGCGINLEFGTDIIFFHKMTDCMKKQVIGRCQRPGRKTRLNIWYLMHENENEYNIIREDTINDGDFIYFE